MEKQTPEQKEEKKQEAGSDDTAKEATTTKIPHEDKTDKKTTPPKTAFGRAVHTIKDNKAIAETALLSGVLMGTTALVTPLLTSSMATTACAAAVLGGSLRLLTTSGDLTIESLEGVGEKMRIPPLTLGLFAGAMASVPELLVAVNSVFTGAYNIGIGQLVGANVAHVFLILGATAAIGGITSAQGLGWKFNTLVMGGSTLAFAGLLATNMLTVPVGVGMVGLAAAYLGANYLINKRDAKKLGKPEPKVGHSHGDDEDHHHNRPAWLSVAAGVAGLAALVFSAHTAVDSASIVAHNSGVSDAIISTLAIAFGVSLPELTFSIKSALKGKTEMAVGNILGCNIFNILFVGGALSLASVNVPESFGPQTTLGQFNLAALATSATLMTAALFANKGGMKQWQGYLALGMYGMYIAGTLGLGGYGKNEPETPEPAPVTTELKSDEQAALKKPRFTLTYG